MAQSVIVSAARTPIGCLMGSLSSFSAPRLAGFAIKSALEQARINPKDIDEAILGCVLTAGIGQAPARQAAFAAHLPEEVAATTVNKVCSSGLKAVALADQAIRSGDAQTIVAGGMESMSNTPYLLPQARAGYRLGNGKLVDSLVHDGLWDPYKDFHMGTAAELCAAEYNYKRKDQDEYAIESYNRARRAISENLFAEEIVPIEIIQRGGNTITISTDEEPGRFDEEKFGKLKPAFDKDGTVTVGNASSINDGAAALIVMDEELAKKKGIEPLARIIAHACSSQSPEWFTTAPASAIPLVCKKAGLKISDIDLFEINEAFACVALHAIKTCNIDPKKVNVHGGAIALGHPIGGSGARILTTLLHAMKRYDKKRGLATLCNGGGEAFAMIVERI